MIQSPPPSSLLDMDVDSNEDHKMNRNRNGNHDEIIDLMNVSDENIDEDEIIDLSEPLRRVGASRSAGFAVEAVDLTGNGDEENGEDEGDQKLPATYSNNDSNSSDDENDEDEGDQKLSARESTSIDCETEWSCPRCTLTNPKTTSRCDACHYINSDIQDQQQSGPAPSSPLGLIGSGALLGAAVGMAGNWVQGRDPLSGAFEGGTTGAVSGALLHEVLQNNHHSRTVETAPMLERHNITTNTRWNRSASHRTRNSASHSSRNVISGRSSVSRRDENTTTDARNENTNTNTYANERSSTRQSYRPRHRANNRTTTENDGDGDNEAWMNLLYQQLQTHGNRNRATLSRFESGIHSDFSSQHQLFRQLQRMQRHREWNTRSRNMSYNDNDIDSMNYEQLLNAFGDGTENMGADEDEIRRLPTHIVGDNSLPKDARQCLICLEDFEKDDSRTILPCLHGFHQNCCLKWLKTNGKCPICKHPISSNS